MYVRVCVCVYVYECVSKMLRLSQYLYLLNKHNLLYLQVKYCVVSSCLYIYPENKIEEMCMNQF